jgi:hypothetical protein
MRRAARIAVAAVALTASFRAARPAETVSTGSRTARLEGTASLDRHRRVVGAAVVAGTRAGRSLFWLTSTDDKGLFVFDALPEGTYRVELRRDGLEPVVKEGIEVRFPFRAVVEVTLSPRATGRAAAGHDAAAVGKRVRLTGIVTVRGAGPLPEARVRLIRTDGTEDPRATLTQRDGSFAVEDVPAGACGIEVLGPGYLPVRTALDLAEDASVEAILVPQPANYVAPAIDLLPQEEAIPPPAR